MQSFTLTTFKKLKIERKKYNIGQIISDSGNLKNEWRKCDSITHYYLLCTNTTNYSEYQLLVSSTDSCRVVSESDMKEY